jgi:transmembrane sensor
MKTPNTSSITRQACEWVAKLHEADLSQRERDELKSWMAVSEEHRTEIRRIAQRWDDLNDLTLLAVPTGHPKTEKRFGSGYLSLAKLQFGFAALAVVALLATVGLNFDLRPQSATEEHIAKELQSYSTEIGEQRLITLPDSSTVLLNTDSRFSVAYSAEYRDIYLIEGEAHFEVQPNNERSFRVFAGKSQVRAVGTAFSVYLKKTTVDVTVTHGSVEIDTIRDPVIDASSAIVAEDASVGSIVKAGYAAEFNQLVGSIETKALAEASIVPAWHYGKLKFTGEPLTQVIEEISRYSPLSIVILDSDLRNLRIGGLFDAGETNKMLEALETGFGIEVEYINERLVHLKSAKPGKSRL